MLVTGQGVTLLTLSRLISNGLITNVRLIRLLKEALVKSRATRQSRDPLLCTYSTISSSDTVKISVAI